MGETRVDLLHLLEDLRDAYPSALEETILTEIVANALDSGATAISLTTDAAERTFTAVDNGVGMRRRDLARYHDLATSSKARGQGIGFAGVGIKLGLLACTEVVTESRRGHGHVATRWHLASRHRAPWKWTPPLGLVTDRGTAVRLILQNPLSPLLDAGFLEGTLRAQYRPILDPAFDGILSEHYPSGICFQVNDVHVVRQGRHATEEGALEIHLARKRKPSAVGYLLRDAEPLPEEQRGVAISTLGKVIKHGWDWLGISPAARERIGGLIEVPALAACLTLNKGDFIRVGSRGAAYLAYRKAIQEAVSRQLATWGDIREPVEETRRRAVRPIERDLEKVLVDLADEFPLLASLVDTRPGGQKRLPIGKVNPALDSHAFVATSALHANDDTMSEREPTENPNAPLPPVERPPAIQTAVPPAATILPAHRNTSQSARPSRYGLNITFEHRPEDLELGRLVESTVVINDAHPAYQRATASRSEGYHVALSVALALAPLAIGTADEHGFVTAFLRSWGEALARPSLRGRRH